MAMILMVLGWLGVAGGAAAALGALMPSLPVLGAPGQLGAGLVAILNGAMLVAFAQLVQGVQRLNRQLEPLAKIGAVLAPRYLAGADVAPAPATDDSEALDTIVTNPPTNAQVYANGNFRVVLMSDGRVIAQTAEGTKSFANLDAYKKFAGLG